MSSTVPGGIWPPSLVPSALPDTPCTLSHTPVNKRMKVVQEWGPARGAALWATQEEVAGSEAGNKLLSSGMGVLCSQ